MPTQFDFSLRNFRLLSLLFLLLPASVAWSAGFRSGAAQVDITPPNGTPMAGFYSLRPSVGVIDSIYAKAIVIEQDGEKVALVGLDVAYTPRVIVEAARKLITEKTGIAGERVMISATHTHSGPTLTRDSLMDDITGGKTPEIVDYMSKLPVLIAKAVADADAKLAPANATAMVGREESLPFNRRFEMKDGTFAWQASKMNQNILRPAGPVDPDVGVLQLTGTDKKALPMATYVNFSMHPTAIGGTKISPDYPGYLAKRMADYYGKEMVTLFANGCCGNINQNNVKWATSQSGTREGERIGIVLAASVLRSLPDLQPLKTFAPRVRSQMVTLQRRTFTDEEIAEARRVAPLFADPKVDTQKKAKAVCILDTLAKKDQPLEVEVQVVAFSDTLAIVSLPGEIFVELGLSLKKASPFKHTFIAELANGSIGYIPNRSAYPQGLYEVFSARCAEGSGEKLIEVALGLLKEVAKP